MKRIYQGFLSFFFMKATYYGRKELEDGKFFRLILLARATDPPKKRETSFMTLYCA